MVREQNEVVGALVTSDTLCDYDQLLFALESFVEGKKPPLFADKVMSWFDYEFFLPFYCFAGLYVAAILLSIFLLFNSKNNVQAQQ